MPQFRDCILGDTLYQSADTIVRRAKHAPSGGSFVIKMSAPGTTNSSVAGRLIHEHRLLEKLAGVPGVMRTHGYEQIGTQVILYLEDQGLASLDHLLIERRQAPLELALRIAYELARALEKIHAAGIVHKDIKPQNILWDETNQRVTLLDFAIATQLAEEGTNAAIPEALEGTLAYMSPEQTGRTARGLDARTDLYSLGIVLFELLAGRRPFIDTDPLALVHAHLAKPIPPLDSFVPNSSSVVNRIVERCLEKHPEQRYQTAKGLAVDLARCLEQLQTRAVIEPFELAEKDFSPALRISQTLVSRDEEALAIRSAFERAADGAVEVLLLGGPSGVGKTALVRAVYQDIAKAGRGLLLSGKHDQLARSVPYAALAQAFGGLLRDIASSPKAVFDAWKARIDKALGPLTRVIADLVPELEWLMGPIAPVPAVTTEMTYNRLKLAWLQFVRAVADVSPPLVLFLDDMQWADPASLELLKVLLTDEGKKSTLIIAAFRDNEIDGSHPLWACMDALAKANVSTSRIDVGPLDESSVQKWLAATFSAPESVVAPLARALRAKTNGNPFFLGQLLLDLHRQKLVQRNPDTGVWQWDQTAVDHVKVTDNVVELMRQNVGKLPEDTQTLLGRAACVGHRFSLAELTLLADWDAPRVVQELHPALMGGLVIPEDNHYREAEALASIMSVGQFDAHYRFLHDRVQQAFYERIDPERRVRTHLSIGRRLREVFEKDGGSNQKLLELTRHLNLAVDALTSQEERVDLARLNLRAARAAAVNGSHRLQGTHAEQAETLLGPNAWHDEPSLAADLVLARAESDFMLRSFDDVHRRIEEMSTRPLEPRARLAGLELRVRTCLASGQYAEGERIGLAVLESQGITYPETNAACISEALRLIRVCDTWLDEHPHGFSEMPADPLPEHLLCDALESCMILCAAIGTRPVLAAVAVARNVEQMTRRGTITTAAPFFLCLFAQARSAFFPDYRGGLRWVYHGIEATKRVNSPRAAECAFFRGIFAAFEHPLEKTREWYELACRTAAASGSFQGTSWGLRGDVYYADLWAGRPLQQVAAKELTLRGVMARGGDAFGQHTFALIADFTAFLQSPANSIPSPNPYWLSCSSEYFFSLRDGFVAQLARLQETYLFLVFGEYTRALERADETEKFRSTLYANPPVTDVSLFRGLAAAKCWSAELDEGQRNALLERLEAAIARFVYFAEGCAENFLHKLRLLEAERARIRGNAQEAMAKYDEAMTLARKDGFLHIEALAAQLCAEYHLQEGRKRIAHMYLQEARDAYLRWNAPALVGHLDIAFSDVRAAFTIPASASRTTTTTTSSTISTTNSTGTVAIDVNTAIRAAQALSSELDPDRVVGRMMELCLVNAGAERG
ncbi:MAG TPA: AAA family ATPase, partial [Polyangium sp.]|nr:AAA family ATPase [Polyangium sp.]